MFAALLRVEARGEDVRLHETIRVPTYSNNNGNDRGVNRPRSTKLQRQRGRQVPFRLVESAFYSQILPRKRAPLSLGQTDVRFVNVKCVNTLTIY